MSPGEKSIEQLEDEIKFKEEVKDVWRMKEFLVPGARCPECNHDVCEASTSTISRDVLFITCMRCSHTW
jgi:hypothetical protein